MSILLDSHKHRTRLLAIETLTAPAMVIMPLYQHHGEPLLPCVGVGSNVQTGQPIASSPDLLSPILHSPISGRVTAIAEQPIISNAPACTALSIVIANEGHDTLHHSCQPLPDWHHVPAMVLCHHLAQGGIAGLGGAVFSTARKLAVHTSKPIETLILNGAECEPFITCDERLMREQADQVVAGMRILQRACQATRSIIAIESDKPEAVTALRAALHQAGDPSLSLQVVPTGYPNGDESQLILQVLQREVPRDGFPADLGIVVHNAGTAVACADWILRGEPLISRIVTVTGGAAHRVGNFKVRLGTPVHALWHAHDAAPAIKPFRLIMGGPMMGIAINNDAAPITKASNCIIAATQADLSPPQPEVACIRCGECMHACPANLLPQQLLAHGMHHHHPALLSLGLYDCIECGCCDYVCPSHIQLAARFHHFKQQAAASESA